MVEGPIPIPPLGPNALQWLRATLRDQGGVVLLVSKSPALLQLNIIRHYFLTPSLFKTEEWGLGSSKRNKWNTDDNTSTCAAILHMTVEVQQAQRGLSSVALDCHVTWYLVWLAEGLTCPSVLCQCHYANNADNMPLISSSVPVISINMFSCWEPGLHIPLHSHIIFVTIQMHIVGLNWMNQLFNTNITTNLTSHWNRADEQLGVTQQTDLFHHMGDYTNLCGLTCSNTQLYLE